MSFVYSHPFTGLANGLNTINAAGGGIGGWVELGRTTLGSAGTSLSVSSLPDKRYYMYMWSFIRNTADNDPKMRFNSDTGSNYSFRGSINGASDVTSTSSNNIDHSVSNVAPFTFGVHYVVNRAANEKLSIGHINGSVASGAATAPSRRERYGKWANTSNAVDEIDVYTAANNINTGSELVVLGWDPDDTHTNNFWEELASVSGSDDVGDDFDTGTFTAKKYLWVQGWFKSDQATSTVDHRLRVGNSTIDTGNNYSYRNSVSGGTDSTGTSASFAARLEEGSMNANDEACFFNAFIVNNASNEKLIIAHEIDTLTGTGAANAPRRVEHVAKWANTSNQIDIIGFNNGGTGNITYREVKVWGAD